MTTLGDSLNNCIDDLDGRTDLNTRIIAEINAAILYWSKESFYFQEKILDFYTSVGEDNYDVFDTGFTLSSVFMVELYDENSLPPQKYRLTPRTLSQVEWLNWPVTINGIPYNYTYFGEQIMLDRPCQSNLYHIYVYGTAQYIPLVNLSDANDFTINASELIEARALKNIWGRVLKDPDRQAYYQNLEAENFMVQQRKTTNLSTKGSVVPTRF